MYQPETQVSKIQFSFQNYMCLEWNKINTRCHDNKIFKIQVKKQEHNKRTEHQ